MTLGPRYLIGVAAIAAAGVGLALAVERQVRVEVVWGVLAGLVLQAPLGWWALRSIGSDRFMLAWVVGMLARLALVGIAGLVVLPALGRSAGPVLGSMVGILVALLLVEGATALREHSREGGR